MRSKIKSNTQNQYVCLYHMIVIKYKQIKINSEDEKTTTWLHPKTGQPVSVMIIPPIEGKLSLIYKNKGL